MFNLCLPFPIFVNAKAKIIITDLPANDVSLFDGKSVVTDAAVVVGQGFHLK